MSSLCELPKVDVFTDGACRGNPGVGGWGAVLVFDKQSKQVIKKIKGYAKHTTNNQMELTAAIEALRCLKTRCQVNLTTDSNYVKNGITKWLVNWKKKNWRTAQNKPVKNRELWQELDLICAEHEVEWFWVKGHAGHSENEMADALANEAIDNELSNSI